MQAATKVSQSSAYGISRTVALPYDQAVSRVTETLQAEGFGILTEIDVKATLKKKLDKDFTRYIILGACNPPLAYRALTAEIDIGLLLPCNVCVYEEPSSGKTVVAAMDPAVMVKVTGNPELAAVAKEARGRLERALAAV
ncbi:MAG: DUF302 domain-containing protein [SAR324 cluster bacterium]